MTDLGGRVARWEERFSGGVSRRGYPLALAPCKRMRAQGPQFTCSARVKEEESYVPPHGGRGQSRNGASHSAGSSTGAARFSGKEREKGGEGSGSEEWWQVLGVGYERKKVERHPPDFLALFPQSYILIKLWSACLGSPTRLSLCHLRSSCTARPIGLGCSENHRLCFDFCLLWEQHRHEHVITSAQF